MPAPAKGWGNQQEATIPRCAAPGGGAACSCCLPQTALSSEGRSLHSLHGLASRAGI